MHTLLRGLLLSTGILFTGCSSDSPHLITSIDGLTSEIAQSGTLDINQNRIVSIAGALPHAAPGTVHRLKDDRPTSTAYGLSTDKTFIVRKKIHPPADPEARIAAVRTAILDARAAAAEVAVTRLELTRLDALATSKDQSLRADAAAHVDAARASYTAARRSLDARVASANALITDSGLLVFRWATNEERSGSAGTSLFSGEASKARASSGYAIVAGMRESTLYVGPDITSLDLHLEDDFHWGYALLWNWLPWIFSSGPDEHVRITTRCVQVQYVAYLQEVDLAEFVTARLSATVEQLKGLDATLAELDRIEVELAFAKAASLSNEGLLGNPEWTTVDLPLADAPGASGAGSWVAATRKEIDQQDGWLTILAVDTDLQALKDLFAD